VWDAVAGVTHVLCLATGDVKVDPQQDILLYKIKENVYKSLAKINDSILPAICHQGLKHM
jgi:hypothetical protein